MTATDHEDLSSLFPTIIHVQDDSGTSPTVAGHGYPLGTSVDVGRVVSVGDVVRFTCEGTDPRGRELRWWLQPEGADPSTRTAGNRVELTWTVGTQSIGDHVALGIGMAADAGYHREGGMGEHGWDGWIRYLFTVNP